MYTFLPCHFERAKQSGALNVRTFGLRGADPFRFFRGAILTRSNMSSNRRGPALSAFSVIPIKDVIRKRPEVVTIAHHLRTIHG